MEIKFELPDAAFAEYAQAFNGIALDQFAREAFAMEAYRRGMFGIFTSEKRERLPFDQLPQRIKDRFAQKLQNHMLEFRDWEIDHEAVVKRALEDWYEEGEGADADYRVSVATRISALTGQDRGEVLLALQRDHKLKK